MYVQIAMDTKLTLKLDDNIIAKAKDYAKLKKTSLSALIENYLHHLTKDKTTESSITPLVRSLSGVIDLPNKDNSKKEYTDFLTKKYS